MTSNSNYSERIIICIAGMPGSGKSVVARGLKGLADFIISMGDIVREEAIKKGIKLNSNTLMEFAKLLRRERGSDFIAREVIKRIEEVSAKVIVIDGVRSLEEVKAFKEFSKRTYIVAIHSSPRTRFNRLISRGREGDPKTWDEFVRRDISELELGLGSVIALADVMIVNEELSLEDLMKFVYGIIKKLTT